MSTEANRYTEYLKGVSDCKSGHMRQSASAAYIKGYGHQYALEQITNQLAEVRRLAK